MEKNKLNIAVLAGGDSSEYYISLQSADAIAGNIVKEKYDVYIVIMKGDEWTIKDERSCGIVVNKDDFSFNQNGQKIKFDVIFPAIHGTPGENGFVQGYFEMLRIPVIGSNVLSSSLTFNKFYCNTFLRHFNIVNIAESVLVKKGIAFDEDKIIDNIGLPCFVKPDAGGSSFGITKVKKIEEFNEAVNIAFEESDSVIIESFIEGTEISCGLFKVNHEAYVLPPAEIVSKNEFFDYQAKYDDNYNEEIIPARIPEELIGKCRKITSDLYDILNCKGIVRMDFILKNNEFWFLEANTIPGMTNESIVPKMIRHAGMTFSEVAEMLINESLVKIK